MDMIGSMNLKSSESIDLRGLAGYLRDDIYQLDSKDLIEMEEGGEMQEYKSRIMEESR
jgi:hypothetical protein